MICQKCGGDAKSDGSTSSTYVGYISAPGHEHDDNCMVRWYVCGECGARQAVSRQNSCPACDWRGKLTCFCHPGEKARAWPD